MTAPGMVIVGAGEAGVRAAFALRERGYQGEVTLIGSEACLPYERPPLSKADGSVEVAKLIATEERFADARITFRPGIEISGIDPAAKELQVQNGGAIAYERLLLATGARPRQLPNLPLGARVHVLRTHSQALTLRAWMKPGRHIAVLGGGFIGLELAAMARALGADVTLVEMQPRILMRGVPEKIALRLQERHVAEGVTLHCGQAVLDITADEAGVDIRLADGTTVAADILIVGIGAQPNTELAERSGLRIENGIAVDSRLSTSATDIFAAGDCCSFPIPHYGDRRFRLESWRNAQDQGACAAANMIGEEEHFSAVPWFWSDQYNLTLQVAGLADGASRIVERAISDEAEILFHLDDEGRLLAASGIGPGGAVARDIRLAEMLIARGNRPDPAVLADPQGKLKSLL